MNWIKLALCVFIWAEAAATPIAMAYAMPKSRLKPFFIGSSASIILCAVVINLAAALGE